MLLLNRPRLRQIALACGRSFCTSKITFPSTVANMSLGAQSFQIFNGLHASYYVHPTVQGTFESSSISTGDISPVLLLPANRAHSQQTLREFVNDLKSKDDVFSDDFLNGVVAVQHSCHVESQSFESEQKREVDESVEQQRSITISYDPETVLLVGPDVRERSIPPGPYFIVGNRLHQAWKIYPDKLNAFMTTVVPDPVNSTRFQPFGVLDVSGESRGVAVPSRSYDHYSKERPLAGKRIAIKDNTKLAGVRTTQNNRAFAELYEPEQETADFVQKLIDLGAVVVGKTQLSAFASAQEPTDHCVDYHAPWNPRGDGYQTPAGSSHGSGAALAGYDWLDYAFGTDTTGSIRYPAAINGVYGMRHTIGIQSMSGIYPHCREFDTIGSLARSLQSHHEITRFILGDGATDFKKYPREILYPTDFLPYETAPMQEALEKFVVALERYLGVQRTEINLAKLWQESSPPEANGEGLKDYISLTGFHRSFYAFWHAYQPFRDTYKEKTGKNVYVGPYMRWRWGEGEKITLEQYDEAEIRLRVFKAWFEEKIFSRDNETGSTAVMILPVSTYAPDYRDTIHNEPKIPLSLAENYMPSLLGIPQLVVPVGEISYESRITGREEPHPVTAGLIGAPGSDLMLINLAMAALDKAGLPIEVQTGRYTFKEVADESTNHELPLNGISKLQKTLEEKL